MVPLLVVFHRFSSDKNLKKSHRHIDPPFAIFDLIFIVWHSLKEKSLKRAPRHRFIKSVFRLFRTSNVAYETWQKPLQCKFCPAEESYGVLKMALRIIEKVTHCEAFESEALNMLRNWKGVGDASRCFPEISFIFRSYIVF